MSAVNQKWLCGVVWGLAVVLMVGVGHAQPANCERPGKLPIEVVFIPLPPGAVEPAGWLRDWAVAAAHGITGHLDERHACFRDGWKGPFQIQTSQANPDGTGWPLEQCGYWLDGLVRLGYVLHDEALIAKAKARLGPIVDGVNRGGRSFIYWKKEPPEGFNSWAHSQFARAMVAWYKATGEKRILDALVRALCDYPVPMGHLSFDNTSSSGLCNVDAILETYLLSGDRRLLDRLRAAIRAPEVESALRAWADGRFLAGHATGAYEQMRLPALFYLATGEPRCLQASLRAFQWSDQNHMLPSGVTSGEEFFSGVGAFRLTETCHVEAQLWSSVWLYRIMGQRSWGDRIERAFFNAGAAPVARDFQTMCYYQSPNRILAESLPSEQPEHPGRGCLRFTRLGYPGVLCCVGSMNRIVPDYVMHLWMATRDQGLAATLYGPCTVKALAGVKVPVKLTCETAYPFEEKIRVTVRPERKAFFPLYFRVPAWCAGGQIAVNGSPVSAEPDAKGFVRICRQWTAGDTVLLGFPMSVRVARGFETEYPRSTRQYFAYEPDVAFQQRRLPYESVYYGPLLFALAIPDQDPNTPLPGARWQYALANEAGRAGGDIAVERKAMPLKWNWPLDAPLALRAPARAFDWRPTETQALPARPVAGEATDTIRLVPYGCTKFRISMFPMTVKAWQGGSD
jgi:uncharacterized protein